MPVGSAAALICDTGALIDYLVQSAPDHRRFRDAIDRARTRYVPGLVLAEVDYFLRDEREAMRVFINDVAKGAFTYAPPTIGQLSSPKLSSHQWKAPVTKSASSQPSRICPKIAAKVTSPTFHRSAAAAADPGGPAG